MALLTPQKAQDLLNDVSKAPDSQSILLKKRKDVFLEVSLHTRGVRPSFRDLSRDNGGYIIPPRWGGEEYQYIFETFLINRHPREADVTRQWRLSQYRPHTKAPFGMLTDILRGAIFQDSQYTLTLPDKDDNDYIWGNNFQGMNLITYMSEVVLPGIIEDPNGYVVRMPSKPYFDQTADRLEIMILFVNSKNIVYDGPEDLVFKHGDWGYWLTPGAIFRFDKVDGGQYRVDPRGYFATMLGHLPASIAGGLWNNDGYYDSYYDKAIPTANEYISSFSAEQLVDKEASHPYITQIADDCKECHGSGEVTWPGENGEPPRLRACPKCKGEGLTSNNPADRLKVPFSDWEKLKDGGTVLNNPDTNINKYHNDKNGKIMSDILRALNLLNIDAAQSGNAKAIDQEKLYMFISTVSNKLFDTILFPTISDIIAFRNVRATGDGKTMPYVYDFTLIKPSQFQIKTAADLLDELINSTKGNIPGFIRKRQITEYVDKRFAGDDVFQKKTQVIEQLDDLFVYTEDEQLTMITTGKVQKTDLIFSRNLPSILDEISREKGTRYFKNASIDDLKALVDAKMKPLLVVKNFAVLNGNGNPTDVQNQPNN